MVGKIKNKIRNKKTAEDLHPEAEVAQQNGFRFPSPSGVSCGPVNFFI